MLYQIYVFYLFFPALQDVFSLLIVSLAGQLLFSLMQCTCLFVPVACAYGIISNR